MSPEVADDLPFALHVLTGAFLGVEICSAEAVPALHPGCQRGQTSKGWRGRESFLESRTYLYELKGQSLSGQF